MIEKDLAKEMKRLNEKNEFMVYNGVYISHLDKEKCIVSTEINEHSCNIFGRVHGGMLCTMIDCAAGALARTDGRKYVTSSLNISFMRNVEEGKIHAVAEVINRGRKIALLRTKVYTDEMQKLLAEGMVTYYCVEE